MGIRDAIRALGHRSKPGSSSPPNPALGLTTSGGSYFAFSEIEKNTTVVACENVIAHSISILPLNLYFKNPKDGSRKKADWHSIHKVLRYRPNLSESPVTFSEKITRHILRKGNAYLYKHFEGAELASLHILNPEYVTEIYDEWPRVKYRYRGVDYASNQVLHIPSLITDDYGHGLAAVDLAKTAVSLGIKFDEAAYSGFNQGPNSSMLIDPTDALKGLKDANQETIQTMARTISDYVVRNWAGINNAGKPLVSLPGWKITELKEQRSNREAELLESRKWQFLVICMVLGVPPWMVDGSMDVKYGGLEQGMTVFLNTCLMPYLRHFEQKFGTLLTPYEQGAYYFEYDFNVLLRPDAKTRMENYYRLYRMGAISPGEIDEKENLPPPPEAGDTRMVEANLMPLRNDVMDAFMASAKLKAAKLVDGQGLDEPKDPSRATGDDKQ